MIAKARKEPQAAGEAEPPMGSVDQIRDILFGAQMRTYEERFSELEARLIDEATSLRDDIHIRFQELERNLEIERGERGDATDRVVDELRSTAQSIADRAEQDRSELRNELAAVRETLLARLDALQASKTDRAALSGLLRQMAAEIDGEAVPAESDDQPAADEPDHEPTVAADSPAEHG
ncbi:MAG: hypothetical protein R2724_17935 [Bryobacterales bacterium]